MKPSPRVLAFAAIAMLAFASVPGASAQDDRVALGVGTPSRLFLQKAYQTVIIGDPSVVSVRADDARSVLIEPLGPGKTNLVFIDAQGIVIANVKVSVCSVSSPAACAALQSSL